MHSTFANSIAIFAMYTKLVYMPNTKETDAYLRARDFGSPFHVTVTPTSHAFYFINQRQ